jgi:hypothetical protein
LSSKGRIEIKKGLIGKEKLNIHTLSIKAFLSVPESSNMRQRIYIDTSVIADVKMKSFLDGLFSYSKNFKKV